MYQHLTLNIIPFQSSLQNCSNTILRCWNHILCSLIDTRHFCYLFYFNKRYSEVLVGLRIIYWLKTYIIFRIMFLLMYNHLKPQIIALLLPQMSLLYLLRVVKTATRYTNITITFCIFSSHHMGGWGKGYFVGLQSTTHNARCHHKPLNL